MAATFTYPGGDVGTYCNDNQVCYYAVTSCDVYPEGVDACFASPKCFAAQVCVFDSNGDKCIIYANECCNNGPVRCFGRAESVSARSEKKYRFKEGLSPDVAFNVS